jgi:hypothetical protein
VSILAPPFEIIRAINPLLVEFVSRVNRAGQFAPVGTVGTSWWRDAFQNQRVGGESDSQHLVALAVDLDHPDPGALTGLAEAFGHVGLVAVQSVAHLHIQAFPREFEVVDRLRRLGLVGI